MKLLRRRHDDAGGRPTWQPIPAWTWMLTAALAVGLTALAVTSWLLAIASHAKLGTDLVNARLDAVRTGLGAGAGAGAAVGLMLAFRRQHHQEISTALTDHDATQRRITELYTRAVEQLGSEKAPVRLGGLYALERLAQDNRPQRQTIVNVICAYLRMPFPAQAPGSSPAPADDGNPAQADTDDSQGASETGETWQQERQVRLTAQRILADHLRKSEPPQLADSPPESRFWEDMRIDLTGATLINFSLSESMITEARFDGATFNGSAWFNGATFNGSAWFNGATFNSGSEFGEATFNGHAWFNDATFNRSAGFSGTTFNGHAWFNGATFNSGSEFGEATFNGHAGFGRTTFNRHTGFSGATFNGHAGFNGATFNGHAWFNGATFNDTAHFSRTTFNGPAHFSRTTFENPAAVVFTDATVQSPDGHEWPKGWQVSSQDQTTVVRSTSSASLGPAAEPP